MAINSLHRALLAFTTEVQGNLGLWREKGPSALDTSCCMRVLKSPVKAGPCCPSRQGLRSLASRQVAYHAWETEGAPEEQVCKVLHSLVPGTKTYLTFQNVLEI